MRINLTYIVLVMPSSKIFYQVAIVSKFTLKTINPYSQMTRKIMQILWNPEVSCTESRIVWRLESVLKIFFIAADIILGCGVRGWDVVCIYDEGSVILTRPVLVLFSCPAAETHLDCFALWFSSGQFWLLLLKVPRTWRTCLLVFFFFTVSFVMPLMLIVFKNCFYIIVSYVFFYYCCFICLLF